MRTLFALLVAVVLLVPAMASADHGKGFHWASASDTFTIPVGNNLPEEYHDELETAVHWWSNQADVDLVIVEGVGSTDPDKCWKDGTIQVCAGRYEAEGWDFTYSAFARYRGGAHLKAAQVLIDLDRQPHLTLGTVCHELGHTLALNHNTTDESCLGNGSEHPSWHDFDELGTLYGHLDAPEGDYPRMEPDSDPQTGSPFPTQDDGGCSGEEEPERECLTVAGLCLWNLPRDG